MIQLQLEKEYGNVRLARKAIGKIPMELGMKTKLGWLKLNRIKFSMCAGITWKMMTAMSVIWKTSSESTSRGVNSWM